MRWSWTFRTSIVPATTKSLDTQWAALTQEQRESYGKEMLKRSRIMTQVCALSDVFFVYTEQFQHNTQRIIRLIDERSSYRILCRELSCHPASSHLAFSCVPPTWQDFAYLCQDNLNFPIWCFTHAVTGVFPKATYECDRWSMMLVVKLIETLPIEFKCFFNHYIHLLLAIGRNLLPGKFM